MWFGIGAAGAIESGAGAHVETDFFVLGVPLFPLRSYAAIDIPRQRPAREPLPRLYPASVARGLSPLGLVVCFFAVLYGAGTGSDLFALVAAMGSLGIAVLQLRTRVNVHPRAAAIRALRSHWLGAPVEPWWGGVDTTQVEPQLRSFVDAHSEERIASYRAAPRPPRYIDVALESPEADADYLVAVATLAELEAIRSGSADLVRLSRAAWEKLFHLHPDIDTRAVSFEAFDGPSRRIPFRPASDFNRQVLIGLGLLLGGSVIGAWSFGYYQSHWPQMVFASPVVPGKDLTVLIDGERSGDAFTKAEGADVLVSRLALGKHEIVVLGPDGSALHSETVDITLGADPYLFAIQQPSDICFVIETTLYAKSVSLDSPRDHVVSFGERPVTRIHGPLDGWFREPPTTDREGTRRPMLQARRCSTIP